MGNYLDMATQALAEHATTEPPVAVASPRPPATDQRPAYAYSERKLLANAGAGAVDLPITLAIWNAFAAEEATVVGVEQVKGWATTPRSGAAP